MPIQYEVTCSAGNFLMGEINANNPPSDSNIPFINGAFYRSWGTPIVDLFERVGGLYLGNKITFPTGAYMEITTVFNADNVQWGMYDQNGYLLFIGQCGHKVNNVDTPNSLVCLMYEPEFEVFRPVIPQYASANNTFSAQAYYVLNELVTIGSRPISEGYYYGLSSGWAASYSTTFDSPPLAKEIFPGTSSGTGGGGGNFDTSSDSIDFPSLPSSTALDTRMYSLYNVTLQELTQFSQYLWGADFIGAVAKLFSSPMDAVISLNAFNFTLPAGTSDNIRIGYQDSLISSSRLNQQFISVDCGELNVLEFWGTAFDYAPYTEFEIYLPYIGYIKLSADDVMGAVVGVRYNIDILTGEAICFIKVTKGELSSILYTFSCNTALKIPLSSYDSSNIIKSGIMTLGAVAVGAATGGGAAASVGVGSAINTITTKPIISHSGQMSGQSGILSHLKPYLTITRPIQSVPEAYANFVGYPSNISASLGSQRGYTVVSDIHLSDMGATITETELTEIEELLKEGVIL